MLHIYGWALAIQVLGGHGYISEYPVEMFYRDNRLNPIHEGTYGIQSIDLLARKMPMNKMAGYRFCIAEVKTVPALANYAEQLSAAIAEVNSTTMILHTSMGQENIDLVLANSVKYLEMFGTVVIAWMWLRQGLVAQAALDTNPHASDEMFYRGKLHALQYFYRFELPEIYVWARILSELDDTTYTMQKEWF